MRHLLIRIASVLLPFAKEDISIELLRGHYHRVTTGVCGGFDKPQQLWYLFIHQATYQLSGWSSLAQRGKHNVGLSVRIENMVLIVSSTQEEVRASGKRTGEPKPMGTSWYQLGHKF